MAVLLLIIMEILSIITVNVYGKTTMDYLRDNQHLTINRDNTDIQVNSYDIVKVNGRRMSYIGNREWIGEDSSGHWDFTNAQQMPASYWLTVHEFEKTGQKLSKQEKDELKTKFKRFGDEDGEDDDDDSIVGNPSVGDTKFGILNMIGRGIQIFIICFVGISVAFISFTISVYIGYYLWDYNLKKLSKILQTENKKYNDNKIINKNYNYRRNKSEKIRFAKKRNVMDDTVCNYMFHIFYLYHPCTQYVIKKYTGF